MQAREWATGYEPPRSRAPAKAAAAHGPARAVFRSGFSILPSFPERSYHFATGRNDSQTFMSAHPRRSEPPMPRTCLAVVLAAGEGTRMRSSRPKALHAIAGRALLAHGLAACDGTATAAALASGPDT